MSDRSQLSMSHLRNFKFLRRLMGGMQRYRDLQGLSYDEVAELMAGDTSGEDVRAWEHREISPTVHDLFRWASALNLNLRFDLSVGPVRNVGRETDNDSCRYCGAFSQLTREHLVPRSRGGSNGPENVGASCRSCNGMKGPLTDEEYMILRSFPAVRKGLATIVDKWLNRLAEDRASERLKPPQQQGPKPDPLTYRIGDVVFFGNGNGNWRVDP